MEPFHFERASDEQAAVGAKVGASFLAGGTTIVDLIKLHVERPAVLVDINPLPLTEIEELPDGGVRVGAMVRNADMANDRLIRERYPMLSQALLAGASPQIRSRATTPIASTCSTEES